MGGSGALHRLAEYAGVQTGYEDWKGQQREVSEDILLAVLRELEVPLERPGDAESALEELRRRRWSAVLEPTAVMWDGHPTILPLRLPAEAAGTFALELRLESGEVRRSGGQLADLAVTESDEVAGRRYLCRALPVEPVGHGYHRLRVDVAGASHDMLLIAAPNMAHDPPGHGPRRWGVFAPLYAVHAREGHGAGTLRELQALSRWTASLGGRFVGTLPLLASYLDEWPFEPSPYSPVSRLFWNELYLDLDAAPGIELCPAARERLASAAFVEEAAALRAERMVDYRRQMALTRGVLEELSAAAFQAPELRAEIETFVRARPRVEDYAGFRATVERTRQLWADWQPRMRDGDLRPGDYDEAAFRYHVYAQFALDRQLQALAQPGVAHLYLDLPVGVNRYGYDVWRDRDSFALGASAGAPPDELFTGGQNWGLPPLHPRRARERGFRYFIDSVRAHLERADMLRIDHVMGLHRMFWVPEGAPATDGVYVRYPAQDLYGILCLESIRNRCALVGEDLGTVPEEVRPTMARHGIHRLFVAQFSVPERIGDGYQVPPAETVASLNTHDVPTFAGFWQGQEIDQRVELGLLTEAQAAEEHQRREGVKAALRAFAARRLQREDASLEEVLRASHELLAESPAEMILVNLEDLWLESQPQNVPGTGYERPNWRRKMQRSLEDVTTDEALVAQLRGLDERRRG